MQRESFDLGVQMHGGGRHSNSLLSEIGPRVTVGLRTPDAPPLDRWLPYEYFQHEVVRNLEIAALAGARPRTLQAEWTVSADALDHARRVYPNADTDDAPSFVVLFPGAGDARRRWGAVNFAELGDRLAFMGREVVLVGSSSDQSLTECVAMAMSQPAIDLAGSLSVPALAALLSRAGLVVANDSGPLHLARAVNTPTVGIYWCGNLINAGPLTNGRHHVALSWRLDCPTCGANCMADGCDHQVSFVDDVPVDQVAALAFELSARHSDLPS